MAGWLKSIFAKHQPHTEPVALDGLFYGDGAFSRYNPDDLIRRRGPDIYREMLRDEQVKAVTKFRRDAITAREHSVYLPAPCREALGDDEADRRIALFETVIDRIPGTFSDAMNNVMTASWFGFSLVEKIYKAIEYNGRSYWGVEQLALRPFDSFEFDTDAHGRIVALRQEAGKHQELDLKTFIHFVCNPDRDPVFGESDLRAAYRPWFSKDVIYKLRNIYMEGHATGYSWLRPKEQDLREGSAAYTQAVKILQAMHGGSSKFIFPKDLDHGIDFPGSSVDFEHAINQDDLRIARALLVPNLLGVTPAGQTGSYSQSTVQFEAFLWTLDADADRLEQCLNEQLFRELGYYNFGDEHYPRIKLHHASKQQLMEIASRWSDFVQKGAVTATEADEAHIRVMLGFPPRSEDDETQGSLDPQDLTAITDLISKVRGGSLPKEAAKLLILESFPMDEEKVDKLLADIQEGEALPIVEPETEPQIENTDEEPEEEPEEMDETIVGLASWRQYAKNSAAKRVRFEVIKQTTEAADVEGVAELANVTDDMVMSIIAQMESGEEPKNIKLDGKLKRRLNTVSRQQLSGYWRTGQKHAEQEITEANGKRFERDPQHMTVSLNDFLDVKAFTMAGKLSDDIVNKSRTIIANGITKEKSHAQVRTELMQMYAREGVISNELAEAELGDLLGTAVASSRLATTIRTVGFEAINEARFAYFTDPDLGGFVQGFEYSAILDERTTQICTELHGHQHPADDPIWAEYNPPNHMNCRSLLIPITLVDEMQVSDTPTVTPQEGFA